MKKTWTIVILAAVLTVSIALGVYSLITYFLLKPPADQEEAEFVTTQYATSEELKSYQLQKKTTEKDSATGENLTVEDATVSQVVEPSRVFLLTRSDRQTVKGVINPKAPVYYVQSYQRDKSGNISGLTIAQTAEATRLQGINVDSKVRISYRQTSEGAEEVLDIRKIVIY